MVSVSTLSPPILMQKTMLFKLTMARNDAPVKIKRQEPAVFGKAQIREKSPPSARIDFFERVFALGLVGTAHQANLVAKYPARKDKNGTFSHNFHRNFKSELDKIIHSTHSDM